MNCKPIRTLDEYQCAACGRSWSMDDEPPEQCISANKATVADKLTELSDVIKYLHKQRTLRPSMQDVLNSAIEHLEQAYRDYKDAAGRSHISVPRISVLHGVDLGRFAVVAAEVQRQYSDTAITTAGLIEAVIRRADFLKGPGGLTHNKETDPEIAKRVLMESAALLLIAVDKINKGS